MFKRSSRSKAMPEPALPVPVHLITVLFRHGMA